MSDRATFISVPSGPSAVTPGRCSAALLAFAIGDALGWPFEGRARAKRAQDRNEGSRFVAWTRSTGGRYNKHDDPIAPGEYSDDTQLMLAVARSRTKGNSWYDHFVHVEIPFWLLYERGGGSATLKAARSWSKKTSPWRQTDADLMSYFEAGGNGCAMRVLPHAIASETLSDLVQCVDRDAAVTHGHPRAIIGARVYAVAAWHALRIRGTLQYGELIHRVMADDSWRAAPALTEEWLRLALHAPFDYSKVWGQTLSEVHELLAQSEDIMQQGPLTLDVEALEQLGALDRFMNGAGTVAAVASLLIASKNATQPMIALRSTATAKGADTDTIAAMCGGLLGAIAGSDWLGDLGQSVQDSGYIRRLSTQLANQGTWSDPSRAHADVHWFQTQLDVAGPGETIPVPINGSARVLEREVLSVTANQKTIRWKLQTSDGQTLYIKRTSKLHAEKPDLFVPTQPEHIAARARHVGVKLLVRNLARSVQFYTSALNLAVTKEGRHAVTLGGVITVSESDPDLAFYGSQTQFGVVRPYLVSLEVDDIASVFRAVLDFGGMVVDPVSERASSRRFRCMDPDGHILDVFQRTAVG